MSLLKKLGKLGTAGILSLLAFVSMPEKSEACRFYFSNSHCRISCFREKYAHRHSVLRFHAHQVIPLTLIVPEVPLAQEIRKTLEIIESDYSLPQSPENFVYPPVIRGTIIYPVYPLQNK